VSRINYKLKVTSEKLKGAGREMINSQLYIKESGRTEIIDSMYIEKIADLKQIYIYDNENTIVIDVDQYPIFKLSEIIIYVDEDEKQGILLVENDDTAYAYNLQKESFKSLLSFSRLGKPRFQGLYLIENSKYLFIICEIGTIAIEKQKLEVAWEIDEILLYSEVEVKNNLIEFRNTDKKGIIDVVSGLVTIL